MPLARRLFATLPWRLAQRLGAALGRLAWRLARRDRRRVESHLALAFPELDVAARRRLGAACLAHLGTSVGEILHLLGRSPREVLRHVVVEGAEDAVARVAAGQPVVVLTGHVGNWELISAVNLTHELGLHALTRVQDDPTLDATAVGLRAHLGSTNVGRGQSGAGAAMLRVLRRGGALALLIDQDIDTAGVWVRFFGRLAYTPVAAARLARRSGAAVVPAFASRLADGTHHVRFLPALELPDDDREATARMTAAIEAQIRRHPEQWVWMHRRWRRRPPEES